MIRPPMGLTRYTQATAQLDGVRYTLDLSPLNGVLLGGGITALALLVFAVVMRRHYSLRSLASGLLAAGVLTLLYATVAIEPLMPLRGCSFTGSVFNLYCSEFDLPRLVLYAVTGGTSFAAAFLVAAFRRKPAADLPPDTAGALLAPATPSLFQVLMLLPVGLGWLLAQSGLSYFEQLQWVRILPYARFAAHEKVQPGRRFTITPALYYYGMTTTTLWGREEKQLALKEDEAAKWSIGPLELQASQAGRQRFPIHFQRQQPTMSFAAEFEVEVGRDEGNPLFDARVDNTWTYRVLPKGKWSIARLFRSNSGPLPPDGKEISFRIAGESEADGVRYLRLVREQGAASLTRLVYQMDGETYLREEGRPMKHDAPLFKRLPDLPAAPAAKRGARSSSLADANLVPCDFALLGRGVCLCSTAGLDARRRVRGLALCVEDLRDDHAGATFFMIGLAVVLAGAPLLTPGRYLPQTEYFEAGTFLTDSAAGP